MNDPTAQSQPIVQPQSIWPHISVIIIGITSATALIAWILYLRPQYDPVLLIGAVGTAIGLATTQIIAIIKSNQHDEQSRQIGERVVYKVNGALHELMAARAAQENAQGKLEGTANEQARVAEQKLATAAAAAVLGSGASTPVPVEVVGPNPIPVTTVKR